MWSGDAATSQSALALLGPVRLCDALGRDDASGLSGGAAPGEEVELVPADDARAVALVDVPERQASGLRVRTVVADELDLRVPAVRRAHGPDVRLRAQHV